jgi:glycosyltransferase involved in cell wall biosynthesis
VIQYFLYSSLPPGWATLVILLSLFNGIQLVFMGIIGEYVGAIFDEVKARPHYIVEEKINFGDTEG